MDDRRFDALTKTLAKARSRRMVLKGLLGLGGSALAGTTLSARETEAARRPAPTPKPPTCPGRQTWNGSTCACPAGLETCGPDCCNDTNHPSPDYRHSECCDNACCLGTCYGEERCCPDNDVASGSGTLPPTHRICETNEGPTCCPYADACCLVDGCCETICHGGAAGADSCCAEENYCPGGSDSGGLCCTGETPIRCDCGTNANACIAGSDDACCVADDCDTPPAGSTPCVQGSCVDHVCVYTDCASGSICCPDTQGNAVCRAGDECCLSNQDCNGSCEACVDFVCADDPATFPCGDECCGEGTYCCTSGGESHCLPDGQCCRNDQCDAVDPCTPAVCVDRICTTASACAAGQTCCGTSVADCVVLQTDENNCGACGVVCNTPPNSLCYGLTGTCESGVCTYTQFDAGTVCDECHFCSDTGACDVWNRDCNLCGFAGDPCSTPGTYGECCGYLGCGADYKCHLLGVDGFCILPIDCGDERDCCTVAGPTPFHCSNGHQFCYCDPDLIDTETGKLTCMFDANGTACAASTMGFTAVGECVW